MDTNMRESGRIPLKVCLNEKGGLTAEEMAERALEEKGL